MLSVMLIHHMWLEMHGFTLRLELASYNEKKEGTRNEERYSWRAAL